MTRQRKITIKQLQAAFEAIIPGFYDAWRKAMNSRLGNTRMQRSEPNPRRMYANHSERLLTVYHVGLGEEEICFCNRGYVPLFAARFPSRDIAWAALRAMDVRDPALGREWDDTGFFASDGTPFVKRWLVTMSVLRYVGENATMITPTWNDEHGCPLAQSS